MTNIPPGSNLPMEEIRQGTLVYDVNGNKVGHVTLSTLRDGYFVVQKGLFFTRELFLPATAIQARTAAGVTLRLSKEELKEDRWKQPPGESVGGASAQPIIPPGTPAQPIIPPTPSAPGSTVNEGGVVQMPPPEEEPPVVNR